MTRQTQAWRDIMAAEPIERNGPQIESCHPANAPADSWRATIQYRRELQAPSPGSRDP